MYVVQSDRDRDKDFYVQSKCKCPALIRFVSRAGIYYDSFEQKTSEILLIAPLLLVATVFGDPEMSI